MAVLLCSAPSFVSERLYTHNPCQLLLCQFVFLTICFDFHRVVIKVT